MEPHKKDVIRVMTLGACLMALAVIGVGIGILVGGHLAGLVLPQHPPDGVRWLDDLVIQGAHTDPFGIMVELAAGADG